MVLGIFATVLEETVKICKSLLPFNKEGKFTNFDLFASSVLAFGFAEKLNENI